MSSLAFTTTPVLERAVCAAQALAGPDDADALRRCANAKSLRLSEVQLVSRVLRSGQEQQQQQQQQQQQSRPPREAAGAKEGGGAAADPSWVHELLLGAAPVLPAPAERAKPHPDLEPRLRRLQAAQDGREYAAMVSDVCGSAHTDQRDAVEMRTYRSQIGVGMNLIVSMGTMFCVGFYAGGTEAEPMGVRATICGLALSILAMLVEITLFVIGAWRVDTKMHRSEELAAGRAGRSGPTLDRTKLAEEHDRRNLSSEGRGRERASLRAAIPGEAYD